MGRRDQLVAVRGVGHPPGREAPGVTHRRVEVDAVGGLGQVLALHGEHPQPLPERRVPHRRAVVRAGRRRSGLLDRLAGAAVLDETAAYPGQAGLAGGGGAGVVADDVVVVGAGHERPRIAVQAEREGPDR